MAVRRIFKKKMHGVVLKSGYVYSFKYTAWKNDPNPVIIFMYALEGINPSTGHQWRFLQGINFSYLPRTMRKMFASDWKRVFAANNGNVRFTYEMMQRHYPWMSHAIRRYFTKPNYYLSNLQEVPFENMEAAIVSTWIKDFSKKVKFSLFQYFHSAMQGRKEIKKKAKSNLDKYRI